MIKEISYFKQQAIMKLKNKWGIAILIALIPLVILSITIAYFIPGIYKFSQNYFFVHLFNSLVSTLFLGFSSIIQNNIALNIIKGKTPSFSDYKIAFNSVGKTIGLQAIFQGLLFSFYLISGILSYVILGYLPNIDITILQGNLLYYLSIFLLSCCLLMLYTNISMAWFILIENQSMKIKA